MMQAKSPTALTARPLCYLLAPLVLMGWMPASAAVISDIYVGTFSNTFADANDESGVRRGGKYVVKSSFETEDLRLVTGAGRDGISRNTYVARLDDVPGATGATNTYELFVPTQNYGILTQTGPDHFIISSRTAQTAEIQFFAPCTDATSCAAQFRGFEFESNFLRTNSDTTPAATDLVFEQFTADANFSGVTVTNHQVNLLDEGLNPVVLNAGTIDVRSESLSASGGQANPGVFFRQADPIIAEAGAAPLLYSASQLSVTTSAGTELVTEPASAIVPGQLRGYPSALDAPLRQADNDLGAGRTDQEDFLDFAWTVNGADVAGNLDGTRLARTVDGTPARFVNTGTRTVSDVNIAVEIQDSGLTTTVDTTSFGLTVTETMTGLSDTDSVAISYQNALPTIDTAAALRQGNDLLFQLVFNDPDLAINALIAGFEDLDADIFVDLVDYTAFFADLIATGNQLVSDVTLASVFGVGLHDFEVLITDRAIRAGALAPVAAGFQFTVGEPIVPSVPEPASLALLAAGAVGFALVRRRARANPAAWSGNQDHARGPQPGRD